MCRLFILMVTIAACSKGTPPSSGEMPETAAVGAATLTSGFATGVLRSSVNVDAFRITRHPITVAQYAQCVAAGACEVASSTMGDCSSPAVVPAVQLNGATATLDPQLPLTCVPIGAAKSYCAWIGGRLPTEDQWLLSARGSTPIRYAWGNVAATCDNHPGAAWKTPSPACGTTFADFEVGAHPKGASPTSIEDVLLTRAELLDVSSKSSSAACRVGDACVVTGTLPGGIEGVASVTEPIARAASFRCVMEEQ